MPVWLALLIAAAASGAGYKAQRDTYNDQLRVLNSARRESKEKGDRGFAEILKSAEAYNPKARARKLDEQQAQSEASLVSALEQAAGDREIGALSNPKGGEQSEAYLASKAKATAAQTREGLDLARLLAKFGGHERTRRNENLARADASTRAGVDLASARAILEGGSRAASLIRPDPRKMALVSFLGALGQGSLYGGGSGSGQTSKIGGAPNNAGPFHAAYGGPL